MSVGGPFNVEGNMYRQAELMHALDAVVHLHIYEQWVWRVVATQQQDCIFNKRRCERVLLGARKERPP